ncbi:MAG TPA: AAA family ATPase [Noviherbaspirillum sp.]|nr:AAA family ATPase [Noviherbaspirillum sp.]
MMNQKVWENQRALVEAFAASLQEQPAQLFETHISLVVVCGAFAYKFKKAVHFDFVDFSTLEARRFYCEEELRLNARLAPDIYIGVVALAAPVDRPVIGGSGPVLEYAVKMRAFEQSALWSSRLQHGRLLPEEVDRLAVHIASFHANTSSADANSPWCTPAALQAIADETLEQIAVLLDAERDKQNLNMLDAWEREQRARLAGMFAERKVNGSIRECHGDLHSGNILTMGDTVEAFDCIEFNDNLRWIDVMNDIAFTCMDLRFLQRTDLAARFLNRYLELTGDYAGLVLLHYYEVHRALIRCKVALLRSAQAGVEEAVESRVQGLAYLAFAHQRIRRKQPAILITHGFSGCGKSTLARLLVEALDAVQLRSDVERKRMRGLQATERPLAEDDLYASSATRDTYLRLRVLATQVVQAGWSALVDATFLQAEPRAQFRQLALELGVPFVILDMRASEATLKARIRQRERAQDDASDAGLEVLAVQLKNHDPLSAQEMRNVLAVDAEAGLYADTAQEIRHRLKA